MTRPELAMNLARCKNHLAVEEPYLAKHARLHAVFKSIITDDNYKWHI